MTVIVIRWNTWYSEPHTFVRMQAKRKDTLEIYVNTAYVIHKGKSTEQRYSNRSFFSLTETVSTPNGLSPENPQSSVC